MEKKIIPRGCILYNSSIYIVFWNDKILEVSSLVVTQVRGAVYLRRKVDVVIKGQHKGFLGDFGTVCSVF